MGPWTGEGHIEMIAPCLGRKATHTARTWRAVGGHPVATLRLFALERAVLAAFVPLVVPAALD
jgi:hypothetical protein